jgi:acyl-CoA hydrolase
VNCWVENYIAGTTRHVASAYLTFVAVDDRGHHHGVPQVVPESGEEKRRYDDAGHRRELRKAEMQRRRSGHNQSDHREIGSSGQRKT